MVVSADAFQKRYRTHTTRSHPIEKSRHGEGGGGQRRLRCSGARIKVKDERLLYMNDRTSGVVEREVEG